MLVLALEASTSSAKALVFNDRAEVVAAVSEPYAPHIASPGLQDTQGVHQALLALGRSVAEGLDIAAVALCSTWHSIAVVDSGFQPVTKTYTWEYVGSTGISARMRQDEAIRDHLYYTTGCMPNATYPRQALLHLIEEEGLDLKNRLLMTQGAYIFHRMTGLYAESICTQAGGGFLELAKKRYSQDVLAMLGIDESQIGPLVTYKDVGSLNEESARALGIKSGIPVVPAHSDGAYNQIGSSCGKKGRMTLSMGTSGAIRLTTDAPMFGPNRETWNYYGLDNFISGAATAGACNCINWFKREFLKNRWSYQELEASRLFLAGDPPVFLPFLFGERCPGWRDDRRAGFLELEGYHTPEDCYLAIQLGTLFSLLTCYNPLVAMAGEPDEIIVSGGILNSRHWLQMLTDIFGRPMLCVENPNASAIGAAVVGLHTVGVLDDINDFAGEFDSATRIHPDGRNTAWYQRQFSRYLDWYGQS